MSKPPIYAITRSTPNGKAQVLQLREPETGEAVMAADLTAYRARLAIRTPAGNLRAGSTLYLTDRAAHFMVREGNVEMIEAELLPSGMSAAKGKEARHGGPQFVA